MIIGDSEKIVEVILKECVVDEYIVECLFEVKVDKIKVLKEKFFIVLMVGDGINDVFVFVIVNVGVVMGEGMDVVFEIVDIVLMKNDLLKILDVVVFFR